jgi:hypothetical protein
MNGVNNQSLYEKNINYSHYEQEDTLRVTMNYYYYDYYGKPNLRFLTTAPQAMV